MVGYIRNDTSNNIAEGNIINASDFDGEFDAIQSAFSSATGHKHDGTAANGAPIEVLGPTQDVIVTAGGTRPKTTGVSDLGTSSFKWRNLYLSAMAEVGNLTVGTHVYSNLSPNVTDTLSVGRPANRWLEIYARDIFGADLELTGVVNSSLNPKTHASFDLGTSSLRWRDIYSSRDIFANSVTLTGSVKNNLTPDTTNTRDLGVTGTRWKDLFLSGGANIAGFVTGTAVTQTNVDSTAGRLTKTGDYGLGGLLPLIGNCAVVDASIVPGDYSYLTVYGSSGGPSGITQGCLSHRRRSVGGGETQQLTTETDPTRSFSRSRTTGAWSAWAEYLARTNIIGIVSATPEAGDLFERWDDAPNSKGYTIFADGTFIFHAVVTTNVSGPITMILPVPEDATYPVVCQATINTAAPAFTYAKYVAGNIEYAAWNSAGSLVARTMQITVTGRCF